MTPQDEQTIQAWAQKQTTACMIALATEDGDAGERLALFCDRLAQLVPSTQIKKDTDQPWQTPALLIGRHGNIAYQAVPAGKMLALFLNAMAYEAGHDPDLPADIRRWADKIDLPALIKIYVTPQCPHCPKVLSQLLALAGANPHVRLTIIDGTLFTEQADADQIRAVPTVLLDDNLRWTGEIDVREVVRMSIQRDPTQLSAASLRQIIETGEAAGLARMMIENGQVFPSLIELLVNKKWPVRLGAMVTVEYLADEAPTVAAQLADLLWNRFNALTPQVQGDVVHVLCQIRSKTAESHLQAIVSGPYDRVVQEAAVEALAEMQ